MNPTEKRIATRLINKAVSLGYTVSVWDGEDWALSFGDKLGTILSAMASTEADTLKIRSADKKLICSVYLVYGNDEDLISDHSDTEIAQEFMKGL